MDRLLTLELLPNELLLDIFEYLPVQDLYKTWFGLNRRLTRVINSFQGFRFEQSDLENIDDSAFAHRVTTLVIRHSNSINLNHYPQLCALKLEWPSQHQCIQTMSQFQLEHLHVGHAFHEGSTTELLKHVFRNGFPHLRSCHLEDLTQYRPIINEFSTTFSSLNSMKILTIHPQAIARLLSLCPDLNRLSIKFFAETTIDFDIFKQWLPTSHKNLRTLILDSVDQMSIETIDSILTFIPNITCLSIISPRCRRNRIEIKHLALTLHRRLPGLRQFYTSIWCDDLVWNSMYTNSTEAMRSLHPLFKQTHLSSGGGRLIISSSFYRSKLV